MNVIVIDNLTIRRANVVAYRTGSDMMGMLKAQLIATLKVKLQGGIAHFVYQKNDGCIREAWGTTNHTLVASKANGNGIPRDRVNCVCYFDVEKGAFRSLCFENLIQIF